LPNVSAAALLKKDRAAITSTNVTFDASLWGLEITIAADSSEFGDYDFWVCVEPEIGCSGNHDFLDGLAELLGGNRRFADIR
jgi:hypothetical protein